MGWTKGHLVKAAFAELALRGCEFDLEPEELAGALNRLDAMVAMWQAQGIRLGYPVPSSPDASSLDQESGLPDWSVEGVFMNLAVRLAAGYGKAVPATTKAVADDALSAIKSQMAMPQEMQYPSTLPRGAGNKPWRVTNTPFMPRPASPVYVGDRDEDIELN